VPTRGSGGSRARTRSPGESGRGVEAEQLFDGVVDDLRAFPQQRALIGVSRQRHDAVAEQAGRRLVAGEHEHGHHRDGEDRQCGGEVTDDVGRLGVGEIFGEIVGDAANPEFEVGDPLRCRPPGRPRSSCRRSGTAS